MRLLGTFLLYAVQFPISTGGDDDPSNSITMEYLDLDDMSAGWKRENVNLPFDVHDSASVVVKDRVYISGGISKRQNDNIKNLISWSPCEREWTVEQNMTVGRAKHCMVSDGEDTIYSIGGNSHSNFMEKYSISGNTWKMLTSDEFTYNIKSTGLQACAFINNQVIVVDINGAFHAYDVRSNSWSSFSGDIAQGPSLQYPMAALIPMS